MSMATIHHFADARSAQVPNLRASDVFLEIRQAPSSARVAVGKEKDRKAVDPPPIIQLTVSDGCDPQHRYLSSPYFFMSCSLVGTTEGTTAATLGASLAGTLVSSLHRLKDTDNKDGAFFIFGDLSVKIEGSFQLQFSLYEMEDNVCNYIKSVRCAPFTVHSTKQWPGMMESTSLTRCFSDQGVRLRVRKEPRTLLRKRGPASEDYVPRHYSKSQVLSSEDEEVHRNESSPPNSGDVQRSMQVNAYNPRTPVTRGHSQQSVKSFSPSHSDERSSKRPRTGSEHTSIQSFGHPESTAPDNSLYEETYNQTFVYNHMPQQSNYGYSIPQPAQIPAEYRIRDQQFGQQRPVGWPPHPSHFNVPQIGHISVSQPATASMPIISQAAAAMIPTPMVSPVYERSISGPMFQAPPSTTGDRREHYGMYHGIPMPRTSQPTYSTSGPNTFNPYQ